MAYSSHSETAHGKILVRTHTGKCASFKAKRVKKKLDKITYRNNDTLISGCSTFLFCLLQCYLQVRGMVNP